MRFQSANIWRSILEGSLLLAFVCTASACVKEVSAELSFERALPPGTQAVILALAMPEKNDPRKVAVWAFDARAPLPENMAGTVTEGQKFYAVPYSASLEDLGLSPGRIEPDVSTPRPLPEEYSDLLSAELEPGPLRWVSIADLPEALRNYPFPRFDSARCLSRGRCLSTLDRGRNDVRCIACERPEILPPIVPAPPLLPDPPQFNCPDRWRKIVDHGEVQGCEPMEKLPPELDCPDGQLQRYLSWECTSIGRTCPLGQWRDDLSEAEVLFVVAGGAPGGSGTIADPYRTLSYAVSIAPAGSTLSLSAESYDEAVVIDRPLRISGACPERTRIVGGGGAAGIRIDSAGVIVENLGIRRSTRHGVYVEAGASATIEGVELIGSDGGDGVLVDDRGSIVVKSALVRGWHSGVNGQPGARVTIEDSVIEQARAAGVVTAMGGVLNAKRFAVRDMFGEETSNGMAVFSAGSAVSIAGAELVRSRYAGLVLYDSYSSVSDVFISDVQRDLKGLTGAAVIGNGGSLTLKRLWIDRPVAVGVHLANLTGAVEDLVVHRPLQGHNIEIHSGARVSLDRLRLTGVSDQGILLGAIGLPPPQVIARDVVIEGSERADRAGVGIRIARGSLDLTRARIVDSLGAGINVHPGQTLSARDILIRGVRQNAQDPGHALLAGARSKTFLERALFSDTLSPVVFFAGSQTATVVDLTLAGVAQAAHNSPISAGITIQSQHAMLRRVAIDDVANFGLRIGGAGTRVGVEDLSISRVTPRFGDSVEAPFGAIAVFESAHVSLRRVEVREIDGEGFRIFEPSAVELEDFRSNGTKGVGLRLLAGELTGRRIHISDAQNEAILLAPVALEAPTPRELQLSHVLIDRPGEEVGMRTSMIKVGVGARLRMESFELHAVGRGNSVLVEQPAVLELIGGLIHASSESVELSTDDEQKKIDALQSVRFAE